MPLDQKLLFESVTDVINLLNRKNADYGDAFRKHGLAGILVRLSDKSLRLQNIQNKSALVVDESAEDTLLDIAGYALLGLYLLREQENNIEVLYENFSPPNPRIDNGNRLSWLDKHVHTDHISGITYSEELFTLDDATDSEDEYLNRKPKNLDEWIAYCPPQPPGME